MPWKKLVLLMAVLVATTLAIRSFGGSQPSKSAAQSAASSVPVRVAAATRSDIDLALTVVGRTEAWSTVTVRARVSGQLESFGFMPGDKVKKGELLAQLDAAPFKAQLDQASGNLASSQAKLDKAQADLQRYAQVLAKGFVSRADYDTYKANVEVDRADLQTNRAAENLAQLQLGYTRVLAPFDGVTGLPQVWPGAQLTASATNIVVLNQIEPIRISFSIPESSLDAVRVAQTHGDVTMLAQLPGIAGMPLRGKLDFIDNAVDTSTSTIVLKGRFENKDGRLTPGQFLEVTLPTARLANAVSIPSSALQNSDKGDFVFVAGADGKAHQRYVSAGPTSAGRIVVNQGLQAGELVITDGQLLLTDGTSVHASTGA